VNNTLQHNDVIQSKKIYYAIQIRFNMYLYNYHYQFPH